MSTQRRSFLRRIVLRPRFWGLSALVALVSFALGTLALAAYRPQVNRGVHALGSILERIPVRYVLRRGKPVERPVAPAPAEAPVAMPLGVPQASSTLPEPAEEPSMPLDSAAGGGEPSPAAPAPVEGFAAATGAPAPEETNAQDEAESQEEWDEEDELHPGEDEMPFAPEDEPEL
ncbi:MAG: hypothetical protein KA712_05230 [Myxococcales bacterium]|nr:hypothetical protein [Myxococcales bacterium]